MKQSIRAGLLPAGWSTLGSPGCRRATPNVTPVTGGRPRTAIGIYGAVYVMRRLGPLDGHGVGCLSRAAPAETSVIADDREPVRQERGELVKRAHPPVTECAIDNDEGGSGPPHLVRDLGPVLGEWRTA
jgi:hypothetical protein